MTPRIIHKTSARARNEARELLELMFSAELLVPSSCVWVVSPWLRDVVVIDNRSGAYSSLGADLPRTELRLSRVLAELANRGTQVVIATRPGPDGGQVGDGVRARAREDRVRVLTMPELHTKGIVGGRCALVGSMNLTHNGIEQLTELVQFTTDASSVASLRLQFQQHYGGGA